jgi:hypothetical protein
MALDEETKQFYSKCNDNGYIHLKSGEIVTRDKIGVIYTIMNTPQISALKIDHNVGFQDDAADALAGTLCNTGHLNIYWDYNLDTHNANSAELISYAVRSCVGLTVNPLADFPDGDNF